MDSPQITPQSYEETILRREMPRWLACGEPEAWAQYRHAAAKALPWFTDVQGGVCMTRKAEKHTDYTPEIYVRGILISEWTAGSSYLDSEVIITSIHNAMTEYTSFARNRCEAVSNTQRENRLVGCMIGAGATKVTYPDTTAEGKKRRRSPKSGQSFFPCPMPNNQTCWVLGFYIITDSWKQAVELNKTGKENLPVTMVRLERWKLEEKAWFASTDASHNPPPLSARDFTTKAPHETCPTCNQTSPRMFEEFFLCRNSDCDDFWKHQGEVIRRQLTYTKPYLQQRERRDIPYKPYGAYKGADDFPMVAEDFTDWWQKHYKAVENDPITEKNYEERMLNLNTGFWCRICGMLNRRLKWNKWDCANNNCPSAWQGHPGVVPAAQIVEIGKTSPPNWSEKMGYAGREDEDDYVRHNFDLRYGCGVTVIVPKEGTNARHKGSDWLWETFQRLANEGKIDLQKQFVHSASEGTVTNHYIHNYGHTYRLAVDIRQQTSFEDAPEVLSVARDVANSLCRRYQSSPGTEDFNQCYVAGYFTSNKMGWHDDGEKGLGSAIATWTLGGEGKMFICAEIDQYSGRMGGVVKKLIDNDLLLVGVEKEAERRKWKSDLEAKLTADPPLTTAEREAAIAEYWKVFDKEMPSRGDSAKPHQQLEIPLTHGSIVVMHGANMQKYYRHKVDVDTPLRVALTFRYIMDENSAVSAGKVNQYPHVPDQSFLKEFNDDVEVEVKAEKNKAGPSRRKQRQPAKEEDEDEDQEIETQARPLGNKRRQPVEEEKQEEEEGEEQSESQVGPSPLKKRKVAKGKKRAQ